MTKKLRCFLLTIACCLATPTAFAQASDSSCDNWFTTESSGVCLSFGSRKVCQRFSRGLSFPPACQGTSDKVKKYVKSVYPIVNKWSGIFNRAVEAVLIKSAIDFYKAAEHSKNMYVAALKEHRWNDAAFIVADSGTPGFDMVSIGGRAEKFYGALSQGRYLDAIEIVSTETVTEIYNKAMPEKVMDNFSTGMTAAKMLNKVANKMFLEYAKIDKGNLDVNSKADRSFYGAIKTRNMGRSARIAGDNTVKGVGGASKYYMSPLITPSFDSVDTFSSNPDPLRNESLQYDPTYEEIIGVR